MTENEEESREEKIEEIAEAVEEENADDVQDVEVETDEYDRRTDQEKEVDLDLEEADVVEEIEEPEPEGPGPEELEDEPKVEEYPEYLNLKIDGKVVKVESSKVWDSGIRTLQKESAADRRLELAAEAKKEAEQTLEKAKARAESIMPTEEQTKVMRSVVRNFELEFPDLSGDDNLRSLVILETDRLRAEGHENDWTTYEKAAKKVQSWHGKIASERVTQEQFKTKLERKRAASGLTVRGVNAKTTTTKKPEAPEPTASDIVSEMRRARHQD